MIETGFFHYFCNDSELIDINAEKQPEADFVRVRPSSQEMRYDPLTQGLRARRIESADYYHRLALSRSKDLDQE